MRFGDEITMDQGTKPAYHGESACLLEASSVSIYGILDFMFLRVVSECRKAGGCRMAGSHSEENKTHGNRAEKKQEMETEENFRGASHLIDPSAVPVQGPDRKSPPLPL